MKKTTYLLCSLLFVLFISGSAMSQTMKKEAVQPFNDGLAKTQKGDYKAALTDFEKALSFDKDYRVYYQIGFAQMKLKNYDEAVKSFNDAIKLNPKFDASYSDLGNVYYSMGKYQDAINSFEKILSLAKNSNLDGPVKFNLALCYNQLATAAESARNYKKAISYLNKSVSYTDYDVSYLALAKDYMLDKQYDKAINAGLNAIKYRKNIKEAGPDYYIGVSYGQKGDLKKAKEYLEKAKEDPVYKNVAETVLKAIKQ